MTKYFYILLGFIFIFSGCAGTKADIVHNSVEVGLPALTPVKVVAQAVEEKPAKKRNNKDMMIQEIQIVKKISGFSLLEDKRPKEDIEYMASVREKVSEEVLRTLKAMGIFGEVVYPSTGSEDVVIKGEIRKFSWDSYETMISYIPGINVLTFFGLPSTGSHAEVQIYLEIKNTKTNEVILSIDEIYAKNNRYSIYGFKPEKAREELVRCFDIVLKKIQEKALLKKILILKEIETEVVKISQPVEEKHPTADSETIEGEKEEVRAGQEAVKEDIIEIK